MRRFVRKTSVPILLVVAVAGSCSQIDDRAEREVSCERALV